MKRKDFGLIMVVAMFSSVFSIIISGFLITTPEDRRQKVEVVEAIISDFERPDNTYFNSDAVNPARKIQVGQDPDSNPFESR